MNFYNRKTLKKELARIFPLLAPKTSMSVSAVTTAIRALSVAAAATASPASDGDDGVPAAVVQEAVAALLAEPLPDGLVASFLATLQLLQPLPPPALLRACAEAVLAHAVRLDLPDEDDEDGEDDPVMEQSNGRTQEHSGGDGDGDGRTIKGPDAADTQEAQLGPTTRRTSPLVDIAGTGCSAAQAGALTTASALVAAACGLRVATLGGSSPAGAACAAEFMEALGAEVALGPEQAAALVQATGFVFLSSQEFHPCLRHVAAARSQLGMGSLFDLLGPVTHPAQPIRQVVGVSDARLGPVLAQLLKTCGARHVLVVHGQDGLDAISPAGNTQAWEVRAGLEIEQRMLEPQADFGVAPVSINDVHTVFGGSSMAERAAAFRRVLHGEQDLLRMVISMNAAAALYVGGVVDTLAQGVERATAAIDRGEVSALLVQYTAMTKALVSSRSPPLTFSIVAPQSPTKVASPLSKSVATAADGDSATPHATVYVSPQDTSAVGDDLRKPPASPSRLPVKPSAVSLDSSSSGAFSMPSRHPTHLSLSLPTAPSTHSLTSTSGPTAALLEQLQYRTAGGVRVRRSGVVVPDLEVELQAMSAWLDTHLGGIMLSDYEQPGRYSKWARGFVDPPLMVVGRGREFSITALNSRGAVLLPALTVALHMCADVAQVEQQGDAIRGSVAPSTHSTEESYSRQPSLFSVVRTLVGVFRAPEDQELGLQGAFGYDLAFQFEPLPRLHLQRPGYQRDMVLFIPDSILVWDSTLGPGSAVRLNYEFQVS